MPRLWNKIVVEEDIGVIEVYENGRMMHGLNFAMCDEDVEAMRQGYKCINCLENLDSAWPKACPVCSYPIAERQAEHFAKVYKGFEPGLRTGSDWEAEADRLEERTERRAFEERASKSGIALGGRGVLIPKGLS